MLASGETELLDKWPQAEVSSRPSQRTPRPADRLVQRIASSSGPPRPADRLVQRTASSSGRLVQRSEPGACPVLPLVSSKFPRLTPTASRFLAGEPFKRKAGEAAWRFLARDTNSPYDDFSPLEKPGVPENWEYQALAVLGDDEAGQPSPVVRAAFGG